MILAGISIKRVKKVKRHSSEPGASLCTVSCTHCITLGYCNCRCPFEQLFI